MVRLAPFNKHKRLELGLKYSDNNAFVKQIITFTLKSRMSCYDLKG